MRPNQDSRALITLTLLASCTSVAPAPLEQPTREIAPPQAAEQPAEAEASADEMAKKLAGPTNALGKLAFNLDYVQYEGDLPGADRQTSTVLLFQPALPYPLDNGKRFFARPAIPIVLDQPVFGAGGFSSEGVELGDIGFDLAYGGPVGDSGLVFLAGLVGTLPTATKNSIGKSQWALGPELMIGKLGEAGVVGVLISHQWDVASTSSSATDINTTGGQYFYTYLLEQDWAIGAGPVWSYDWNAGSGDELTLPLSTGVSRTMVLGSTPWRFAVEGNYYIAQADPFGPEWSLRLSVTPVVPLPW